MHVWYLKYMYGSIVWCSQEVKQNPFNYDSWFDYLRLVESDGGADDIREIYERAIANVPPSQVGYFCLISGIIVCGCSST